MPTPTKPLLGRAVAFDSLGRYDDEARDYDEVLRLYERAGARDTDAAITYSLSARRRRAARSPGRGSASDARRYRRRAAAER